MKSCVLLTLLLSACGTNSSTDDVSIALSSSASRVTCSPSHPTACKNVDPRARCIDVLLIQSHGQEDVQLNLETPVCVAAEDDAATHGTCGNARGTDHALRVQLETRATSLLGQFVISMSSLGGSMSFSSAGSGSSTLSALLNTWYLLRTGYLQHGDVIDGLLAERLKAPEDSLRRDHLRLIAEEVSIKASLIRRNAARVLESISNDDGRGGDAEALAQALQLKSFWEDLKKIERTSLDSDTASWTSEYGEYARTNRFGETTTEMLSQLAFFDRGPSYAAYAAASSVLFLFVNGLGPNELGQARATLAALNADMDHSLMDVSDSSTPKAFFTLATICEELLHASDAGNMTLQGWRNTAADELIESVPALVYQTFPSAPFDALWATYGSVLTEMRAARAESLLPDGPFKGPSLDALASAQDARSALGAWLDHYSALRDEEAYAHLHVAFWRDVLRDHPEVIDRIFPNELWYDPSKGVSQTAPDSR